MGPELAVGAADSVLKTGMAIYQQKQAEKAARLKRQQEQQNAAYGGLDAAWGDYPNLERQNLSHMLGAFTNILL